MFRLFLIIIGLISFHLTSLGQLVLNQPNTTGSYINPVSVTMKSGFGTGGEFLAKIGNDPGGGGSIPGKFLLENTLRVPISNVSSISSLTAVQLRKTYRFIDNFGRTIQEVYHKQSPTQSDIIQHVKYDANGRESRVYLPYVDLNPLSSVFREDAEIKQSQFYSSSSGWDPLTPKTNRPYAESVVEINALNPIKEQGGVGVDWQLGGGKTTKFEVLFNNNVNFTNIETTRKVARYKVIYNSSDEPTLSFDGYYDDNTIAVKVSKMAHWSAASGKLHTSEEYIDGQGKSIALRTFYQEGSTVKMSTTYSVYNDKGQLVYALPAVLNPDLGNINAVNLAKYGYSIQYDHKGQQVITKGPAVEATYYVYNKRGDLVASQTAGQRAVNEWSFIKYDVKGRPVMSGVWNNNNVSITRAALQTIVLSVTQQWENRAYGAEQHSYTNLAWPLTSVKRYDQIQYYDEYGMNGLPTKLAYTPYGGSNSILYPSDLIVASKSWTDNNQLLWSVNYYNQEGDLIQRKASNHLGGHDVVDNMYNFAGELTQSERKHYDQNNVLKVSVKNTNNYDHAGRLLVVKQRINNQPEITLTAYTYNALGQVVDKKLHKLNTSSKFLQSMDYRYNEKGWLTSINDPDLQTNSVMNDGDTDSNPDLFGMQLSYNTDPVAPQYNSNIAASRWKTSKLPSQSVAPPKMGYQYRYDALGRLTHTISEQNNVVNNAHDENMSYDISGNITTLQRKAYTGGSIETIDDLVYTYEGYRTKKLDDVSSSPHKNLGYHDKASLAEEYAYDANGNMTVDRNKDITLEYNDRNLVRKITFGGNNNHKLEFLYDRTGKKLQAKYTYPTGSYTIDYLDGIQYQQGQIAFIHTGEGRARRNGTVYSYEYDIKDHLNNVRVTFMPKPGDATETTLAVLQQNSYYPYGLPMYGDAANGLHLSFVSGEKSKYLYSDKELYDQGDLNWFDHGSRMYDPATGRWSVMDPAVQFANPYLAMGNNPVIGVDPNGEFFIPILVGAAVGVLANGLSNSFQSKSFFNGWDMAAIMGGIGGYMAVSSSISTMTAGQQALGSGVGVASSYLPGVNIPIGDLGYLSLNPAVAFGGGGFQLGAGAGLSLPWAGGFSIGLGGGASWGKDGFTGNRGWTSSVTGAIGYSDGTNSFSLSTSQFNAPGLRSQTLGTFSYRHKSGFGVGYSNDGAPFDKFGYADPGSDGFRSAALQLSYKELTVGTRIFTGDRNVDVDRPPSPGYPRGTVGNQDAYSYMSSPLFIGYKGMRAGVDDWRVGHGVQNILAHDILKPQAWFRWREHGQNMKLYGGYFSSNNPYILW